MVMVYEFGYFFIVEIVSISTVDTAKAKVKLNLCSFPNTKHSTDFHRFLPF